MPTNQPTWIACVGGIAQVMRKYMNYSSASRRGKRNLKWCPSWCKKAIIWRAALVTWQYLWWADLVGYGIWLIWFGGNGVNQQYTVYINVGVSENSGTPKSSILLRFSIINHPFWGTPIFGNTHVDKWIRIALNMLGPMYHALVL